MNFFTFFKQRTILSIPVKFSILVRYTGGNGGKKVIEEITKKCIGAGCSSTRPYFPTSTPNNNKISTTPDTETPTTTNNSPDINQTAQQNVSFDNNQSMIKSLSEQVQHIQPGVYYGPLQKSKSAEFPELPKGVEMPANVKIHPKDPMKAYKIREKESNEERPSVLEIKSLEDFAKKDVVSEPEDPLMAIRLKENVIGDTKHVNFGELNEKGTGIISYGAATSSDDRDKITGKPTTKKLSATKMDDSFIAKKVVVPVNKKNTNEPDFIAGVAVSEETNGQRMRVFNEPKEYEVSSLGMDYIENNPDVEQKIKDIIKSKKKENDIISEKKDDDIVD